MARALRPFLFRRDFKAPHPLSVLRLAFALGQLAPITLRYTVSAHESKADTRITGRDRRERPIADVSKFGGDFRVRPKADIKRVARSA